MAKLVRKGEKVIGGKFAAAFYQRLEGISGRRLDSEVHFPRWNDSQPATKGVNNDLPVVRWY